MTTAIVASVAGGVFALLGVVAAEILSLRRLRLQQESDRRRTALAERREVYGRLLAAAADRLSRAERCATLILEGSDRDREVAIELAHDLIGFGRTTEFHNAYWETELLGHPTVAARVHGLVHVDDELVHALGEAAHGHPTADLGELEAKFRRQRSAMLDVMRRELSMDGPRAEHGADPVRMTTP
ncbi:MAG: hypothetical protein JXB46_10255 [Candidatus Eisenbacteria bacterium]|nr:hypothetical protein [Candidatus Eisenbacteria bacterium]